MKLVPPAVARVLVAASFVALVGSILPPFVHAQTITDGLIGLLNTQTLQTGDVVKDQEAALTTTQTVARALSIELATIPVTSSAGGFVYRFNRSLAVVERASDSFGPFFAERALRPGRAAPRPLARGHKATLNRPLDPLDWECREHGCLVASSPGQRSA